MSGWQDTPFKSIEEAHATAEKFGMHPTAIAPSADGKFKTFQVSEGKEVTLIAQAASGGPVKEKTERLKRAYVPEQDPTAPRYDQSRRFISGPWVQVDFDTVEEAVEQLRSQFINPDNVETMRITLVRVTVGDKDLEYEFAEDAVGCWQRVLSRTARKQT